MYVERNVVALSPNHYCHGNLNTCLLCVIVDLHLTVNNIKLLSFVVKMQQWAQFALLSSYKIFLTSANSINVLGILLSHFNQIWSFSTDFFLQVPNMKFHGNPCSANRDNPCGQSDGRTDMTHLMHTFLCLSYLLQKPNALRTTCETRFV